LAVQLCTLFIDAAFPETMLPAQGPTGLVKEEDAGEQLPEPQPLGVRDERWQKYIAEVPPPSIAPYIHREPIDAAIAFPSPIRSGACPADDLPLGFAADGWIVTDDGTPLAALILRRA
jgi:hypothetical protein